MSTPDVSVIIPVYNVEDYVRECVVSIQRQILSNIEIIVVDDGTKDNSIEAIQDLIDTDERIKLIHKENGGLSSARNAGLDHAAGAFISFIDGDDAVDPDFLYSLYTIAVEQDAEVVRGSFRDFGGEVPKGWVADSPEGNFTGLEFMKNFFKYQFSLAVWSSLFRREFIETYGLRFIEGILNEDGPFWYDVVLLAKNIVCTNKSHYRYRVRDGSILTSNNFELRAASGKIIIKKTYERFLNANAVNKLTGAYCLYSALNDWSRQVWKNPMRLELKEVIYYFQMKVNLTSQFVREPARIRVKQTIKWKIIFLRATISWLQGNWREVK